MCLILLYNQAICWISMEITSVPIHSSSIKSVCCLRLLLS